MNPIRTDVLGVPVDAVTMKSTLQLVRNMLTGDATHTIVATNPEKVIAAQRNIELLRALENASLVIPDGIGVVVAARWLGKASMQRVPGSDLMPEICRIAAEEGHSIFLFGAKPGVASKIATLLQERFPGLKVAGTHHGYVPDEEMDQVIDKINETDARVVFVGLGSPKQEFWMDRYGDHLNVRICQGVGGSFDALCGYPRRAPKIMQRLNLEWLHRLITQPKRAHRQMALPRFAAQVVFRRIRGR